MLLVVQRSTCALGAQSVTLRNCAPRGFARVDPASRYKCVENGNYIIELGRAMDLSVVNMGGLDIVDGNHKLLLAFMWYATRRACLRVWTAAPGDGAPSAGSSCGTTR